MKQEPATPLPGSWAERRHNHCKRLQHRRRQTLPSPNRHLHRCNPTLAVPEAGSTIELMNRLPSYDCQTSRSELRFFLGLGLAAITIIAITGVDAARFSSRRQEIAAALSDQTTALAGASTNTVMALTNLATLRPDPAEERSRLGPIAKPKS